MCKCSETLKGVLFCKDEVSIISLTHFGDARRKILYISIRCGIHVDELLIMN